MFAVNYLPLSPQRDPQKWTLNMVAVKKFSLAPLANLFPPRTFKMTVPLVLLQSQLAILCFWRGWKEREKERDRGGCSLKWIMGPIGVFRGGGAHSGLRWLCSHYTPQPPSHKYAFNRCLKRDCQLNASPCFTPDEVSQSVSQCAVPELWRRRQSRLLPPVFLSSS